MTRSRNLQTASWAVAVLLTALIADAKEAEVEFRKKEGALAITVSGRPLATYVPGGDEGTHRPFFKDMHAPGGIRVSRNHPPRPGDLTDHATYHPGLWLAFGDISGNDYWRIKARVAHDGYAEEPRGGPGRGTFAVRNRYLAAPDGKTVCLETCRYTILVRPAGFLLVWDSVFTSDTDDFTFGDQEEMGLGIRVHTPMNVKGGMGRILTSNGHRNEKEIWGKIADWCDYGGSVNGKFAGVTLMPDPANFRQSWFHARDYGLLVANPYGRNAFTQGEKSKVIVKKGESLRLRYGVLLHSSEDEASLDLASAYRDFLAQIAN